MALQPAIGAALATIRAEPETIVARMSGSGASAFALCVDGAAAARLAARLAGARSDWWVAGLPPGRSGRNSERAEPR